MSKRGDWLSFNSFRGGEQSDLPPHMIPDDSLLKASNVVTDKIGRLSKRGPIQPYTYNNIAGTLQQVGVSKVNLSGKTPNVGYGVNADGYFAFALPEPPSRDRTGIITGPLSMNTGNVVVPLVSPQWGPSFNTFGLCSFPLRSSGAVAPVVFFGSPRYISLGTSRNSSVATLTVLANREDITYSGTAFTLDESDIGKIIYLNDSAAGVTTKEYVGIITSVVNSTTFTVYPAPSQAFSAAGGGRMLVNTYWSINGRLAESGGSTRIPAAATFGCVHQNRVVLLTSSTTAFSGTLTTPTVDTQKNVISWSSISGESATAANTGADGLLALLYAGWPKSQNVVLDTSNVVGLVSMDANNLLVLCADKTLLISGTLGTVLPAAGTNTSSFNIRTVSAEVGCVDAASIQRTPLGVMFAGRDGIYITDGASFTNVTEDKIQNKWTVYDQTNSYAFNRVTGSAVIRDTHYVIFSEEGPNLICDLYNDFAWSELDFEPSIYGTLDKTQYVEAYPPALSDPGFISTTDGPIDSNTDGSTIVGVSSSPQLVQNSGTQADPTYALTVLPNPPGWSSATGSDNSIHISNNGNRIVFSKKYTISLQGGLAVYEKTGGVWSFSNALQFGGTGGWYKSAFAKETADRVAAMIGPTVQVYTCSPTLVLETTITPPTTATSIAMSGNGSTLVIGSGSGNGNRGRIYVYTRSGTTWTLAATLDPAGAAVNDSVGLNTIRISGDGLRIVVPAAVNAIQTNIYTWIFQSGSWVASTTLQPFTGLFNIRENGVDINNDGSQIIGVDAWTNRIFRYKYVSATVGYVVSEIQNLPKVYSVAYSVRFPKNSATFYVTDYAAQYKSMVGGGFQVTPGFHIFNVSASNNAKPIFGVGVHDWSGSTEVYAPRLNNSGTTLTYDSVVLLDSILDVDNVIQTDCPGFNQLCDAATDTAYNAEVVTKSFALGDPTNLKAYKAFMMTYAADARVGGALDYPVEFRYAESLQPVLDFSAPAYAFRGDTSANTKSKPARISLVPRPIDNGVAFGLNTVYDKTDSATGQGQFKLYEIGLNAAALRKGRIIQ
jgi:hypothetical protein